MDPSEVEEGSAGGGGARPKLPVLTVLKKGTVLKNIFLNSPPSIEHCHGSIGKFIVGRHPDCHIVLDHPSISRFHLEIQVRASPPSLVLTDLSSVHGTWVSGRRIEPHVEVEIAEGDTLKLGASSRVYIVRWVPIDSVSECENLLESVAEEKEETLPEEDNIDGLLELAIPSAPDMPQSMLYPSLDHDLNVVSIQEEHLVTWTRSEVIVSILPAEEEKNPTGNTLGRCSENQSPPRSEKQTVASSLLSRRMRSITHLQIHNSERNGEGKDGGNNPTDFSSGKVEELIPKALFTDDSDKEEEEVHFSDKENLTPVVSSRHKLRKAVNLNNVELRPLDEEIPAEDFPGDQDVQNYNLKLQEMFLNLDSEDAPDSDRENQPNNTGNAKSEKLQRTKEREEQEAFGSDKENQTPNTSRISKAKKKPPSETSQRINSKIARKMVERLPFQPLLDNSNSNSPISEAGSPYKDMSQFEQEESISENHPLSRTKTAKKRRERVPFQSLFDNSITRTKSPLSYGSDNTRHRREDAKRSIERIPFLALHSNQSTSENDYGHEREIAEPTMEKETYQVRVDCPISESNPSVIGVHSSKKTTFSIGSESISEIQAERQMFRSAMERKNKWSIIVDVGCFTDDESRQSLQLLEGIRGTRLIIPRIVIRELDYLNRHDSLFRRTTKASLALQWIEECMVNTSWWIHVQNSGEIIPVAPTPPATPRMDMFNRCNEFDSTSNSSVFGVRGSLTDIASPTSEDHILDCALLFKRLRLDEQIVLLTNSVALKIKAMAEGLLCETPKEFRASLVNPFSDRFLWVGSSPRGPTWSLLDEVEKMEKNLCHYNNPTSRRAANAADSTRGLKLILLHNSHYGHLSTVR